MGQADHAVDDAFLDGLNRIVECVEGVSKCHQVFKSIVFDMLLVMIGKCFFGSIDFGQQQGSGWAEFGGLLSVNLVEVETVHQGLTLFLVGVIFCFCHFLGSCFCGGACASVARRRRT